MRIHLFLFLFVFSSLSTQAQETINGTVVDAVTGETLPGASLHVEGTYTGTITNALGVFSLSVPEGGSVLIVRFIGYKSESVELGTRGASHLIVGLERTTIDLPEIVITGDDPAIGIMRRVIEEKANWQAELSTYAVNAYNRFRMENDTGIVSIWESSTRAFWDRERGVREVSLWQQQTQNMKIDEIMPAAMFVMNLYDDDVEVVGHNLMGVTHPDALDHYRFKLESIQALDETEVYIISVAPRNKTAAGFVGTLSVLDGAYALLEVDLRPGKSFLFPPPIQELSVRYKQQFSQFGGTTWLPIDFQADIALKIGLGAILEFPVFKILQLSRLSDFEINIPLPDSLYESDDIVVVDSNMVSLDALPPQIVGVPLTREEQMAYVTIDSTMTLEKAFEPTGLLSRFVNLEEDDNGSGSGSGGGVSSFSRKAGKFDISLRPELWYNRVEGAHLGTSAIITPQEKVQLLGSFAYESARRGSSYSGGIRIGSKRNLKLQYASETRTRYQSPLKSKLLNSGSVLVGNEDYFDYLRVQGWQAVFHQGRFTRLRLNLDLMLAVEEHSSLQQGLEDSFLGTSLPLVPNAQVEKGTNTFVRLNARRTTEDFSIPMGPQKMVEVELEKGLGGEIADGGDYFRAEFNSLWRFNTFFSRRLMPNALDLRVTVGGTTGTVPVQKLGIVDGSSLYTTFGSLKTLEYRPYEGDRWALLAWEHTFRTVPFELIGWDWAIKKHWNMIVHGAHGWSEFKEFNASTSPVLSSDGWHQEMGVSLSGIFTIFRLDTAWRLDEADFRGGIAIARIF